MKRFTITFLSHSTGTELAIDSADAPADALKLAQRADTLQNLRGVRIVDRTSDEKLDPKAFAAKHKL
jgi:hypothetical protein